jgi:hypothetical protein
MDFFGNKPTHILVNRQAVKKKSYINKIPIFVPSNKPYNHGFTLC